MNEWINQGMKMQLWITNKEQAKQTNILSQRREWLLSHLNNNPELEHYGSTYIEITQIIINILHYSLKYVSYRPPLIVRTH